VTNGAKKKVLQFESAPTHEHSVPEAVLSSPLYGVAMLKIAMELKKPDAPELEEILRGVLTKMNLPETQFRAFLTANGGLLRAIAQRRRY
jgi:hypothetical protein